MAVIISSALVLGQAQLDQPLTHARIGYQSVLDGAVLTGTAGLDGFPLINLKNPATFERYRPSAIPATIDIDCLSPSDVDYLAIQGCNIGLVQVFSSTNGSNYDLITEYNLGNTECASMALFELTGTQFYRIVLDGNNPDVRAMKLGKSLAMERAIYGGHSPITLSPIHTVRPNLSEKGQFLGSSLQRKGFATQYTWNNLTPSWYRNNFDPFAQSAPQANPFFIAWRPISFPNEVAYCWATDQIQPNNTGVRGLMQVSLSVEGYASAR
jgi:hypothetical protein